MKTHSSLISTLAALLLLPTLGAFAQKSLPTIQLLETFDPPGVAPTPMGINQRGDIVGTAYKNLPRSDVTMGFVRFRSGASVILRIPDAKTYAQGINASGTICGYYRERTGGVLHGWFLTHGVYTTFDIAGAGDTSLSDLNDAGDFVGYYANAASQYNAFLDRDGVVIPIDLGFDTTFTSANAISSDGRVTGTYTDGSSGMAAGYIRAADGTITAGIQDPDAVDNGTICNGINSRGWVVGSYSSDYVRGTGAFLYLAPHKFINYSFPGAINTYFTGINDQGRICGYYIPQEGGFHSMILQVVK